MRDRTKTAPLPFETLADTAKWWARQWHHEQTADTLPNLPRTRTL